MRTLKIGKLKFENPFFLAPMVDITDFAYRKICRDAGAGMAYTEMIHVDALMNQNDFVRKKILIISEEKKPVGIQITSNKVEKLKKAVKYLEKFDVVDLNCGCPSELTIDHGSGSYLLKSPNKIKKMIQILKDSGFTTTAKIRLGFNKNNVLEVSKKIESAGADAITVHGRLATENNSVPVNYSWIKKVKENVNIPVIGNGDISSPEKAKEMFDKTNCDGIMLGRGALGNPYLFTRINSSINKQKEIKFDFKKNISYFIEYLSLLKKYDFIKMQRIKYVGGNFFREISGSAKLREKFMKLKTFEEIEEFTKEMIK